MKGEFNEIKKIIQSQKRIVGRIKTSDSVSLKNAFKKNGGLLKNELKKIYLAKPLPKTRETEGPKKPEATEMVKASPKIEPNREKEVPKEKQSDLERVTLKRIGKEDEGHVVKKEGKPSKYIEISNKLFSKMSHSLIHEKLFRHMRRDLIRANMKFVPASYLSVILLSTLFAFFVGIGVFVFFLVFNVGPMLPIITLVEGDFFNRFLKVFWLIFIIPLGTFAFMFFYPAMERKAIGNSIDQELPFATIHMSSISGSMIEPSKIFDIIIVTKEYPHLEKEFIKLINKVNIYGMDLVSALRSSAFNTSSKKLAELFTGLATTITSGGDLPEFFEKRSQSLLFEYRLEREKYSRTAETFMDIYISVVIAAPMILMLLLMMMKVSGLGVSLSTQMITIVMIMGVTLINIIFLTFLNLRKQGG